MSDTYVPYVGCAQIVKKKACNAEPFGFHYRANGHPRLVCLDHMTQAHGYTVPIRRAL